MISFVNHTKTKLPEVRFLEIGKKVLALSKRGNFYFSLAFISAQEIKAINKQYRHKNKPTDVLSFENIKRTGFVFDKKFLGDIIICPEIVAKNAKRKQVTFNQEMLLVYIHGILHLLGMDHEKSLKDEKRMDKLQNQYVQKYLSFFNRG